jgi:hypothetical protein
MALKGRRYKDITIIQAKSWDTLAKFQTMHFMKDFKWWCNHWAHCTKSQGDYLQGKCCYNGEINSVWKLYDHTMWKKIQATVHELEE